MNFNILALTLSTLFLAETSSALEYSSNSNQVIYANTSLTASASNAVLSSSYIPSESSVSTSESFEVSTDSLITTSTLAPSTSQAVNTTSTESSIETTQFGWGMSEILLTSGVTVGSSDFNASVFTFSGALNTSYPSVTQDRLPSQVYESASAYSTDSTTSAGNTTSYGWSMEDIFSTNGSNINLSSFNASVFTFSGALNTSYPSVTKDRIPSVQHTISTTYLISTDTPSITKSFGWDMTDMFNTTMSNVNLSSFNASIFTFSGALNTSYPTVTHDRIPSHHYDSNSPSVSKSNITVTSV